MVDEEHGIGGWLHGALGQAIAAWLFYTAIPLPASWPVKFQAIARFAPAIGILIGTGTAVMNWGLSVVGMPVWPRMAVVIALGIGITGGLHLDGAMDTADGLSVMDPERRLEVMADSVVGAFGAIALGVILLLKLTALVSLASAPHGLQRVGIGLVGSAAWGRWGQLMAIAQYPYLKGEGKGKFHREDIQGWREGIVPACGLWGLLGLLGWGTGLWVEVVALGIGGMAIAWGIGAWFNRQLGGHTGDTYGAVVEWTEAFILLWLTLWL